MRHLRRSVRTVMVPLLVVLVALCSGWWAGERNGIDARSSLASALDSLPTSVNVAGVTDWSAIRETVGGEDAALRDLTTRSVLAGSVDDMRGAYGWSVADLDWEAFGQTSTGGILVARWSGSLSLDRIEEGLGSLGYEREGGVWTLDAPGRARIGPELAAVLGAVAIVPGKRLLVAGADEAVVRRGLAPILHGARSLLDRRAVADLASALSGAEAVLVQAGRTACAASALPADADVAAQAAQAVERVGPLAQPVFAARGLSDDGRRQSIGFAAVFDSSGQAVDQARVRGALATGAFIGRSGLIEDSLELRSATARGAVSLLRFDLDPDRGAYMSGEGPLLFAGCP